MLFMHVFVAHTNNKSIALAFTILFSFMYLQFTHACYIDREIDVEIEYIYVNVSLGI